MSKFVVLREVVFRSKARGFRNRLVKPIWRRTGFNFKAYGPDAGLGVPTCRFFGTPGFGPNSHFYTIDARECALVLMDPHWQFMAHLATWIGQAVGWYRDGQSAGFIGAVVGAIILLLIYRMVAKPKTY